MENDAFGSLSTFHVGYTCNPFFNIEPYAMKALGKQRLLKNIQMNKSKMFGHLQRLKNMGEGDDLSRLIQSLFEC